MNQLNLELQGRRSDFVTCAQKIKGYMGKLITKNNSCIKFVLASFHNFNTTVPTSECIAACIVHLEVLHVDFERRYNDLIKIDYPLLFVDLENYVPGDENVAVVEMLLDLKENEKQRRRFDKEGVFVYISIKDSHPNVVGLERE